MKPLICKQCGGQIDPRTYICNACGTAYEKKAPSERKEQSENKILFGNFWGWIIDSAETTEGNIIITVICLGLFAVLALIAFAVITLVKAQ